MYTSSKLPPQTNFHGRASVDDQRQARHFTFIELPQARFFKEEYLTTIGDDRPHHASKLVLSGHPLRRPHSAMVFAQVLMIPDTWENPK